MTGRAEHSTDADLLSAHVAGDPDAFGELVRRHRDRLWAVALRTLGDREEAADALQEALISAYRAADRFRGDSAVTTWLHRIVVNACLDRVRRRQARPAVGLADLPPNREPVAALPDQDTAREVWAALAQLPAEQRVPLVLLEMQGYSVAEIAEILGVAEGTVKSRCARGRARLAALLGHLRVADRPKGSAADSSIGASKSIDPGEPVAGAGNPAAAPGVRSAMLRQASEAVRDASHEVPMGQAEGGAP
ncbi:MAG: RNA polymerase sigma factor SigM [Micromonosporaceae bacterium]|nr:RNA polymerase sigma factor SigM [Micromonosporaceae bacterium]